MAVKNFRDVLLKIQKFDQNQANSYVFILLIFAALTVGVSEFIFNPSGKELAYISILSAIVIAFNYWLHLRHWQYSDFVLVLLLGVIIGLGSPKPTITTTVSLAVLLPPIIATLLARRKLTIVAGAVFTLGILLIRAHEKGVYADRINLIIIAVAVICLVLTRIVLENTTGEHKEAEHWRQLSEAYLRSIGDGIVAIDRQWNITLFNPAASKISGWSREEAIGTPFRTVIKFIRERDRSENLDFIEHAMVTGQAASLEGSTLLITKDNKEIPIGDSASPVFDENGNVNGAIIVFRDLSAQHEGKLLHSDFAYMSHQLRTPVNEAMLTFEAVLDEKDPAKIASLTQTAYNLMKSTVRLSDQALMVSDLDEGIILPKKQTIKLVELLNQIVEQSKAQASKYQISLNLSATDQSIEIQSDPQLLNRAFSELVANSIMYSKPGQSVKLSVSVSEKGALVEINDSSIGIMEEEKPLIFTKFFRGSNFDKARLPGSGLGLYISQQLIELLGGKIWFESTPSRLTTFYILLPIK